MDKIQLYHYPGYQRQYSLKSKAFILKQTAKAHRFNFILNNNWQHKKMVYLCMKMVQKVCGEYIGTRQKIQTF